MVQVDTSIGGTGGGVSATAEGGGWCGEGGEGGDRDDQAPGLLDGQLRSSVSVVASLHPLDRPDRAGTSIGHPSQAHAYARHVETVRTRPRAGAELELEIDSLAQGGRGVARADGYVVFVAGRPARRPRPGPADEVEARLRRGHDARDAQPEPRADRRHLRPRGRAMPGRALAGDDLRAPARREGRPGRRGAAPARPPRRASSSSRSSRRSSSGATATSSSTRSGRASGSVALGFHRRGSWAEIVDVEDCRLASEANNAARNAVREWARARAIPAYESGPQTGVLRNLVVREGRRTGQVQTRLVTSPAQIPRPPVDLHTVIEGPAGGTDGPTGVLGAEHLTEELCGLRFRISHNAFLQTNTEMAERLYAIAAEFAGLSGRERVFDLFCGIGTIGLSLAGRAGEVWGLEGDRRGGRRRRGQRGAERDRQRPLRLRRRAARDRAAARARPAGPTWWSSTRRARGCRRRSSAA